MMTCSGTELHGTATRPAPRQACPSSEPSVYARTSRCRMRELNPGLWDISAGGLLPLPWTRPDIIEQITGSPPLAPT